MNASGTISAGSLKAVVGGAHRGGHLAGAGGERCGSQSLQALKVTRGH